MNSKIIKSKIYHNRLGEKTNSFSYNVLMFLFDISELSDLNDSLKLFNYNKLGVFRFSDNDFLHKNNLNILEKLKKYLSSFDLNDNVNQIFSLTTIRFLNHTFNPITIYYVLDQNEDIICHIAEVNNTFGEGHLYLLKNNISKDTKYFIYETPKNLRVSPLYDVSGYYQFKISRDFLNDLSVHIDLYQDSKLQFKSGFKGKSYKITDKNLFKFICKMPFNTFLTVPRILYQAGKMHFLQKIPFAKKHVNKHKDTYESSYPPYIRIL
ncbi:MAG: hypothetical protein CL708_05495 [Chloroflexi bacterium]|nr:hypothetical protein [Chloroflexota bacterium]|tara:strand:- start:62 stop:859 length:798 start_codon:yes stop_codon:yes gene_type:complete